MGTALFFLYLAGISENIRMVAFVTFMMAIIVWFFVAIAAGDRMFDDTKDVLKRCRKVTLWVLPLWLIAMVTPTENFLYIAAGINAGQEVAETDLAGKAVDVMNAKLDEMLAEYGLETEE